jgi:hypothetical protein
MKWQYAVIVWVVVFAASLVLHEAGHLWLQAAYDPTSELNGITVLGIGNVDCHEPFLPCCAVYHSWFKSPMHLYHDMAFQVFAVTMFCFPFTVWLIRRWRVKLSLS